MSTVLDITEQEAVGQNYHAFNQAVWDKLIDDPDLAKLDFRIETDEHGQMITSPPPAPSHGRFQSKISLLLGNWNPGGEVITECPISTRKGVKAADIAWCSCEIWNATEGHSCFLRVPEICVEVISPRNTASEIAEKKSLYFEEGAREVWLVEKDGSIAFFTATAPNQSRPASALCETAPRRL